MPATRRVAVSGQPRRRAAMTTHASTRTPGRIAAVDIARTLALVGMVVFHFAWDLEMFGHLPAGTVSSGAWPGFARLVAGSFLFLAGVSLVLAHGPAIRWRSALRRIGVIAAAAAAVTAATWLAMPDRFVFFGILHSIAVASLLGLAFLRAPVTLTLAIAGAVLVLPLVFRSAFFDPPWLVWIGLSERRPVTLDFEPVFPWFAPCLLGIAAARLAGRFGLWDALHRAGAPGRLARWAGWPGRHSLVVYLAHQPLLIGGLWAVARFG